VPEQEGQAYAYMRRWGISETNGTEPFLVSDMDIGGLTRFSRVTMPHIIPLGTDNEGMCRLYLHMDAANATAFDYEDIYFAYEDADGLGNVYSELAGNGMEVRSFRDDCIEATVEVNGGKKVLFTSIPYSRDWELYVDGEKMQTIALLDEAFLGVCLEEGKHELKFKYNEKYRNPGLICMLIGTVLVVIPVVRGKYGRDKIKEYSQVEDNRL
jgi:hypothetical protein